jgi:hypothetical protein
MQRCETDALYRMLSERPASFDGSADAAAAAAGRDAEFDRTQMEAASLQVQVLPSSQLSDSGRYCTSEGKPLVYGCCAASLATVHHRASGPLGHVDFRQPGDSKTQKKGDKSKFIPIPIHYIASVLNVYWSSILIVLPSLAAVAIYSTALNRVFCHSAGDKYDEVLHLQDFGWKTHG